MNDSPENKYLTVKEACLRARICRETLREWRRRGLLGSYRPNGMKKVLIDREELDRLLAGSRVAMG